MLMNHNPGPLPERTGVQAPERADKETNLLVLRLGQL